MKSSNSMPRPSGKSIYRQRKEYAQSISKMSDFLQYRVEHLLTCDLDSRDVQNLDDCLARLKMLDAKGRVWGQDMIIQFQGNNLLLVDIETKEELECFPIDTIMESQPMLNSCIYNSILTLTVKDRNRRKNSVFMFQCEEVGAELINAEIGNVIRNRKDEREDPDVLRSNLENMLSHPGRGPLLTKPPPQTAQPEERWNDYNQTVPWNPPNHDEPPLPERRINMEEERPRSNPDKEKALIQRDIDILNHVLNDVEVFSSKLQQDTGTTNTKKSKKKKEKKKDKKKDDDSGIPESAFIDVFQKIKYGINLLGKLDSNIQNPSPEDLSHVFFSTLPFFIQKCPSQDLAMGVISPLLTKPALYLLSSSLTKEESNIWMSLGKAWSTPRAEWPNPESVPPYTPVFYDGWEPPVISPPSERKTRDDQMFQRSQSIRSNRISDQLKMVQAMYDFNARNSRELTVQKGDVLEVLDENKQWWMVRNKRGDQGYVPSNILEPLGGNNGESSAENPIYSRNKFSNPELTERSSNSEVANWLKQNGFSPVTVKCISILNGDQLFQLSRQEILSVCPEEGNEVYARLKDMKLAAETGSNSPGSYHHSQPYFNY